MRYAEFCLLFAIANVFRRNNVIESWYINSTGGSFPSRVYQEATFAYQFLPSGNFVSYLGEGSTTGKCNIMGYWHAGNTSPTQSLIPASVRARDTLICTDACTVASCGISSVTSPRFDRASRFPLIDFAGSDSLLKASDYAAFPDLQMLPALAGAAVAVYNIPELVASYNSTGPLVLSRQNLADIFKGKILFWNNTKIRINNPVLSNILSAIAHPIRVVVRTDSSGTSEIFSTALSLFDPEGLTTPDYSFGAVIGSGSNPSWCGMLTDEVQVLTVTGCNSAQSTVDKMIYLRVVSGTRGLSDVHFACDASASNVTAVLLSTAPGPGLSTIVSKDTSVAGVTKYTIGYSDAATLAKNWYQPDVVSVPVGLSVVVSTLQEGGYYNSHFNSTYFVTPLVQSIWVSSAVPSFAYNVTWIVGAVGGVSQSVKLNSVASAAGIMTAINTLYPSYVSSVVQVNGTLSTWTEYRVTFTPATSPSLAGFNVAAKMGAYRSSVYITAYLSAGNYPLFYDYAHPRGYGGSGKYTCYLRQYGYLPWSYYTGNTNPGVIAEVFTSPYSIGYSVLTDAQTSSLPMASLINKALNIVQPTAASVAYAIMDQGGNLDNHFNAVLADGSSLRAWPISGFSYFVIRTDHHIGSCSRRSAAMSYLYNYYHSDTVKIMASDLGYATLPDFIRDIVVAKLVSIAKCDTGEYALSKYVISPVNLMTPVPFAPVLQSYLSVYQAVTTSARWNVISSDDSRALWTNFNLAPSTTVGVFTLFNSRAQRLSLYTNRMVLSAAFAHVPVAAVYHLDQFSACSNSVLRVTSDILAGIFGGTVKYWNDPLIASANFQHASCLPASLITVVVRSASSDTNTIFLRYLTLNSPSFKAIYAAHEGASDMRLFDFSTVIPSGRLESVTDNSFVDNEVVSQDLSIGYYLHVAPPTSNVALYCADSTCSGVPIAPNDNGASVSLCQNDASTVINPSDNVYSYDLMLSNAVGCYPIVGTIDYSVSQYNDPQTCGGSNSAFTTNKVKLGAFLYNGSAIVKPLSVLSAAPSTNLQRADTYSNICDLTCNGAVLGYTFCGYRDCSWLDDDYIQLASDCHAATQRREVTYQLTNSSNGCLTTSSSTPTSTSIECSYLLKQSKYASGAICMCIFGAVTCGGILYLSYKYRHEQVLKRSQLVFIYIFLVGAMLMNLTVLCMYGPNSNVNCMLRVWAVNLSSTIMFAPLIMKLHRVDILYRTLQMGGRRKRISDFTVGSQVLGLLCVDIFILIVWTFINRPRQVTVAVTYPGTYTPITDFYCNTSLDQPFEKVMVAWKAGLLAFGIMKAIQCWNVPEEISEAKYFAIAIYNIAVVGSFTYFLSVFGNVTVEAVVILRSVGLFVSATVSAVVIMVPKLLVIQLSWAEVFLGAKTSYKEEDYSYSSSAQSPNTIIAAVAPKTNPVPQALNLVLDLEKINMPPAERRL